MDTAVIQRTLASTASLLHDMSRATMLLTLLDGRTCTASELARSANISPQTASFHLEKLVSSSLLSCACSGNRRYFRLGSPEVAHLLETLLALGQLLNPGMLRTTNGDMLKDARVCYNHLAGRAGVHLFQKLTKKGWLAFDGSHVAFTNSAEELIEELAFHKQRLPVLGKPCFDWAECTFHIAGDLGLLLLNAMLESRWFLSGKDRSLVLTEKGRVRLSSYDLYPWAN
jgi:DNA-binding transcriptional ArsR family regulator